MSQRYYPDQPAVYGITRLTLCPVRIQRTQPIYGPVTSAVAISEAFNKCCPFFESFGLLGAYQRNRHQQNQTIRNDIRDGIGFEIHEIIGAVGQKIQKCGP